MNNIFIGDISVLLHSFFEQKKYTSIFVLVDENTKKHCYKLVKESIPNHYYIEITSGEQHKNIQTCNLVWEYLTNYEADRKSLLINLGGGVITDLGGFCAATYKRGIDFINIPTTLLSMIDASIGGKLGVDFSGFKNQLGYFKEPNAIFIDKTFLKTLENRQIKNGYAEMIKHGLISDLNLNHLFNSVFNNSLTDEQIRDSVQFKKSIVEQDFYEQHYRKILNFGHTVGHAIESYFLTTKTPLLHGESIYIGMVCELYLSNLKLNLCQNFIDEKVKKIVQIFSFKMFTNDEIDLISSFASQDKKNKSKQIMAVLIEAKNAPKIDVELTQNDIKKSLQFYNTLLLPKNE